MRAPLTALCLLVLGLGCSRGATRPAPAPHEWPPRVKADPDARQVFNDATAVRGDTASWVAPELNQDPGAIHVGETTRTDLLKWFGYPTHRRTEQDGAELWLYSSGLRPTPQPENPLTTRSQRVAMQRKLVITFAPGSEVVTAMRTYVTGERFPDPFKDHGPDFPELEPEIIPAEDDPLAPRPPEYDRYPIQPRFPEDAPVEEPPNP